MCFSVPLPLCSITSTATQKENSIASILSHHSQTLQSKHHAQIQCACTNTSTVGSEETLWREGTSAINGGQRVLP